MCPANTLFAWPHHGVPHWLMAPPWKTMICWSLSGGCPHWGCSGTAFAMMMELSFLGPTRGQCPNVHQRAD